MTETASSKHLLPPLGAFRSKKDAVSEALRAGITKGLFKPGERLVIDDLAAHLGTSAIPVREALQQLQAEGLVTIQPYAGAIVTPIAANLIVEIFELLEALELISGRAAYQRMNEADFAAFTTLLQEMDTLEDKLDQWSEANVRLHQFICDCAAMPLVKSMLNRVLDQWNRLRSSYLSEVFAQRVHAAQQEHWQMFDAMRAGDEAALAQIVRTHNQAARAAYTERFQQVLQKQQTKADA